MVLNIIKYLLAVLLVSFIVIGLNYQFPNHFKYIDKMFLNQFFSSKPYKDSSNNVVIIDIDDKSLSRVGQWPWSRKIMAKLTQNLIDFNPSVIGYGIIFSEADRTSPSNIYSQIDIKQKLENYDEIFANTIEESNIPIILAYSFLDNSEESESVETPYVPSIIKNESKNMSFYGANSILLNLPIIQDSAYSSGFLNSITDEDGMILKMPLLMAYKDSLFPSFALEIIRTIYSTREVVIKNSINGNIISLRNSNANIIVDNSCSLFLNYINYKKHPKHISAVDILNKDFTKFLIDDISGKIVLIGSTATGMSLETPTPFGTKISFIDLQSNIIQNILTNDYLLKPTWEIKFQYIVTVLIAFIILSTIFYGNVVINLVIALLVAIISYFTLQYFFTQNGYILSVAYMLESVGLSFIISIIAYFIKNKKEVSKIKGQFASKVSKEVMEDLLSDADKSSKKKTVTIFFSDIVKFTKISEKINDPQILTKFINRYMDAMTKNIMTNKGTIDKFIGDAIMAYWNAPNDVDDHEDKALTSSIEQLKLLDEINKINLDEKLPTISIRIGLNTGNVFVGEVGGEYRSDYTVMGKAVNHAAIMEQICKFYKANLLITEYTKKGLQKDYIILKIDIIRIDGTSDAFDIYQVFDIGLPDEFILDDINSFEKAVELYRKAKFDEAVLIFRNLYNKGDFLNPYLCKIYIDRCEVNSLSILSGKFDPTQHINKSLIQSA